MSTIVCRVYLKFFFAPPEDAVATYIHTAASSNVSPGGYYSRGLWASNFITSVGGAHTSAGIRILIAAHLDWLLRLLFQGTILSSRFFASLYLWPPGLNYLTSLYLTVRSVHYQSNVCFVCFTAVEKVPVAPEASKMHVAEEMWEYCARMIGLPTWCGKDGLVLIDSPDSCLFPPV